jgi:DNA polymerase-4
MALIACVQIPNLPIAIAWRDGLAPTGRSLVLFALERRRAIVYVASDDTGLTAGMPLRQARVGCPRAIYLPAEPERERSTVAALAALLGAFSPRVAVVEPLPNAVITFDLGKITFPQAIALIERLNQRIRSGLGLLPALGVASTALVAQQAAWRAGMGIAVLVPPGTEAAFLAPQPITSLPVDIEILDRMERLGLRTIGDVARLPIDALQAQFGGAGPRLYQLARGIDTAPIPKTIDAPTISRARRFAGPLLDRGVLEQVIEALAARLAAQLLADGWAAGTVRLTLAVDDGAPVVLERRLAEPSSDGAMLTAALLALSRSAVLEAGVTAITVAACDLVPTVVEQLSLFVPAGGSSQRLRDVLARLNSRFAGSLLRARLVDPDAQLPERRVCLEPQ